MTWDEYYDKFYEWAYSTQASRISKLTSFGSHEQVAELVQAFADEKTASRLANKAMAAGVRFVASEIVDMQGYVAKECMNQMVRTTEGVFTQEQVEELVYSIDDDIYADLERRYCDNDTEEFPLRKIQ